MKLQGSFPLVIQAWEASKRTQGKHSRRREGGPDPPPGKRQPHQMLGRQISPVAIGFPTSLGKRQLLGTPHLSPGSPAAPRCEAAIRTAQRGRGRSQLGTGWGSDAKSFPVRDTRQQRDSRAGRRIWKWREQPGAPAGPGPPNSEHMGFQGKEEEPGRKEKRQETPPSPAKRSQPAWGQQGENPEAQGVVHRVQTFSSWFPCKTGGTTKSAG